jgi:8-oxo-dGTP pyrophosphatase MutT (NUDIX family)
MWILLGMFLGYILFGDSGLRGGGIILTNSKKELLLRQNARTGEWGFPKGTYEPEDMAYYFTAIRELEEETTFQAQKHYDIQPGGCRYGDKMYFYGTLIDSEVPQNDQKGIGWFSRAALPDSLNKDTLEWISVGMPSSCYLHEEL